MTIKKLENEDQCFQMNLNGDINQMKLFITSIVYLFVTEMDENWKGLISINWKNYSFLDIKNSSSLYSLLPTRLLFGVA